MFKTVVNVLSHIEEIALAYISLTLAILIVLEILLRSSGIVAFNWLEEFGRFILIFITLCGAGLAVKHERHPSMTALYSMVSNQATYAISAIVNLFLSLFFGWFDYYAWLQVGSIYRIRMETSTLGVPFYLAYLPIAFFCFVICVRYFLNFVRKLRSLLKHSGNIDNSSALVVKNRIDEGG